MTDVEITETVGDLMATGHTFTIEPGSIVVLRSQYSMSYETTRRLKEELLAQFPPDVKVLVLTDGLEMAVGRIVTGEVSSA